MSVSLGELFEVKSGDYHALKELDDGDIPLVSCGDVNHGFLGLFDIPPEKRYSDAVTVAYNGAPLTAKYRPYQFGAKDDIGVLMPRVAVEPVVLVYIAAALNGMRWRFSYGRKCFRTKLELLDLDVPVIQEGDEWRLDGDRIGETVGQVELDRRPKTQRGRSPTVTAHEWRSLRLDELFVLRRGDFHSLARLDPGGVATVSRTESDNGVVGYYAPPEGASIYQPGLITVSSVSGDAFVQAAPFIATDNVIVLEPAEPMEVATAYFLAAAVNEQKWRYGYGRQCYREKLSALSIRVPWRAGKLDEATIGTWIRAQVHWDFVESEMSSSPAD